METFSPIDTTTLTEQGKNDAIASLMFLAEKRDDRINGKAIADGRKQCEYIKKRM